MATKQEPREKLEAQRERILAQMATESKRRAGVVDRMGFGYAMRGYSRLKNLSFSAEDRLRERLDKVEGNLLALGWQDPSKRREPVRTEAEQLRHYCDVMGLDYEEEINKRKVLKIAQEGTFVAVEQVGQAT